MQRLVRRPTAGDDEINWDPATGALDGAALEGAGAIVNLAGAGIGDRRWTPARKQLLAESRIAGASLIAATVAGLERPPSVVLSASAIGFYGDRGDTVLTEDRRRGVRASSPSCANPGRRWPRPGLLGVCTVLLRTGVVLAADGPFLRRQLPLFKLGLGGRLGPADRWVSWISLVDVVAAICRLLDSEVSGPVNLTAPDPVTNEEFTRALGRVLHRPAVLPVPVALPSLLLGAEAVAGLTQSARVIPEVLLADGFTFAHTDVTAALAHALGRRRASA